MKRKFHVRFGGRPSEKCSYSRATRRRPTLRERLAWTERHMDENAVLLYCAMGQYSLREGSVFYRTDMS